MKERKLYSIGQVSKICDVSHRMLRYYEEIGLITPDRIAEPSRYRYYSVQTMRHVQTVRYMIDEGFQLDEIKEMILGQNMDRFQELFLERIQKTQNEIGYYYQRLDSLKAWYALVVEGRAVHRHQNRAITMKYVPEERFFYYDRKREITERDSDAYLEIEYFTMSKRNGHSMVDVGGAFYMKYDSVAQRMDDTYDHMALLQTMYPHSKSEAHTASFGGFLAVSSYHIGSYGQLQESYARMLSWADEHSFRLRGDCCERHVLDVYSTNHEEYFVTELLLPVEEDAEDFGQIETWKCEHSKEKP